MKNTYSFRAECRHWSDHNIVDMKIILQIFSQTQCVRNSLDKFLTGKANHPEQHKQEKKRFVLFLIVIT